jgi:hypothetical protein
MNTEAFVQTHSQGLLAYNLAGIDSSFSPDGKLLALALQVLGSVPGKKQETWLYNLLTRELKLVDYPAAEGNFFARGLIWQSDQLYMQAASTSPDGQTTQMFATASFDNPIVKVIPTPPPAVQAVYTQAERKSDRNARFRVWSESSCRVKPEPHCGQGLVLAVEDRSTRQRRIVSPIESDYFFDGKSSVVIYVSALAGQSGWQHGVTALDLRTSRKRLTALPGDNTFNLIAEQRVPDGYLIAYWTEGDCNPADTDRPRPFATGGSQPAQVNVCFATIASP